MEKYQGDTLRAYRFMNRKKEIAERIDQTAERIRTLREQATGYSARLEALPGSAGMKYGLERILARAVDLERELDRMLREEELAELETRAMIGRLDKPTQQALMEYRYLFGLPWAEVCDRVHLSKRAAYENHRRALERIGGMLNWEGETRKSA